MTLKSARRFAFTWRVAVNTVGLRRMTSLYAKISWWRHGTLYCLSWFGAGEQIRLGNADNQEHSVWSSRFLEPVDQREWKRSQFSTKIL